MRRALIFLLILLLSLSFCYAALESVHDCEGEGDCPICKIIAVLSRVFTLVAVSFVSILCFALISSGECSMTERESIPSTLIVLCVKITS